jgi:alkanesulfonate monooxygenase SsuD/methylene tetrahydromethanopterin reductase-like flavin-dependent oxidoreductase (luciferase family)
VPYAILTVSVTIGETAEHAADLSLINELFLLRLRTGRFGQYPTLEEAKAYQFSDQERALIASMPLNFIAGTADEVYREVTDLAELCQADEVMITTTLPNPADRRRTLLAMAEQFGLVGAGF